MTIEIKEKGTKEFYKEVVNVTSQYRQLLKKPEAKLKNNERVHKKTEQYSCADGINAYNIFGSM